MHSLDNITLYFGVDTDDPTRAAAKQIEAENSFVKIVDIPSVGHFQNLGVLWNICARASTEEIIAMIGDDMVFMTKDWDVEILKEFKSQGSLSDDFKMVHCYDGKHGAKIAVNCFIPRKYMEITGYFMREEFPVDKVDIWLQQIFNAFDRLCYRGDIHIEHRHWSFGKSRKDNVAVRMRANNAEQESIRLWSEMLPERFKEAEKISQALGIMYHSDFINNKEYNEKP